MDYNRLAQFILRVGVAFAFLYPPIDALRNPYDWVGYFPVFLQQMAQSAGISDMAMLHTFGVIEIGIALWILWGRYIFWPSMLATITLLAIVAFNMSNFVVIFRDVSIAAAALALALMNLPQSFAKPTQPQL